MMLHFQMSVRNIKQPKYNDIEMINSKCNMLSSETNNHNYKDNTHKDIQWNVQHNSNFDQMVDCWKQYEDKN